MSGPGLSRRDALVALGGGLCVAAAAQPALDWRDIANGHVIPDEGYADQPYVVQTRDGHWLCVLTTGKGVEGEGGQHVISTTSSDQGKTWSKPVDVEPANGPEASWAVPLVTRFGRVYVFYTYNRDNVRLVPEVRSPGIAKRVDTLGIWAFKYSDDGGRTWSKERFEIPLRPWDEDASNNFGGQQRFFWSVAKPVTDASGNAYIGFARISRWGSPGVLMRSRGFAVSSANILSERDPSKIRWTMLPRSQDGLRAPKGPIAEETNITVLGDGSLYALYRTIDGYPCHAYSRDRGLTWTEPAYATYAPGPGARRLKNPRAFTFARRFSSGMYLLWFHNQGGEAVHGRSRWDFYQDRNPGWVCAGIERNGALHWSEPEILLYDRDPKTRMSYPDFVEGKDGRIFITETQKSVARVHEIDAGFLRKLFGQFSNRTVERSGLALEKSAPGAFAMPAVSGDKGFSLDFDMQLPDLYADQMLIDARDATGKGLAVMVGERFNLKLVLHDGRHESIHESDFGTHAGTLRAAARHHVTTTVDAGPRIVSFVVDGVFNDGGPARQFGWSRLHPDLSLADLNGDLQGNSAVPLLRIYDRPLLTSEAVGNSRAATTGRR
jgi:hypothetical protein